MVAAALSAASGIAAAKLADNVISLMLITVSAAASAGLLFYLLHKWKILELIENINKYHFTTDTDRSPVYRKMLILVILFFVTGVVWGKTALEKNSVLEDSAGVRTRSKGVVSSVNIKEKGKYNLTVNIGNGEHVLVYVKGFNAEAVNCTGAVVSIGGRPELPSGAVYPNGFDYSLYLKSQKIYMCMSAKEAAIRVIEKPRGLWEIYNRIVSIKSAYEKELFNKMDDEAAGVFCGILFGDTSFMDENILKSFRAEGIGHLLAASGLHAGFVYAVMRVLLRRPTRIAGNLFIAAVMLVYAAFAGFSASVIRAVFMITVHIISQMLHRRYDFLSCTAFCFICMLAWEPAQLFSGGFQLTFLAAATIAVILKRFEKRSDGYSRLEERLKYSRAYTEGESVAGIFANSLRRTAAGIVGIQAGLAPAAAVSFHYISPAAFLLNTPAIAVAGLAVPIGLIIIPFFLCADIPVIGKAAEMICGCLLAVSEMLLHLLIDMNNFAENSMLHARIVSAPSKFIILMYYFCIFFFCSELGQRAAEQLKTANTPGTAAPGGCSAFCRGRHTRGALAVLTSAALLCGGIWAAAEWEYISSELLVLSDGGAATVHIRAPFKTDILINCGGSSHRDTAEELYIPYLLSNGIKDLELVILTDLDKQHCSELKSLSEIIKIKKLAVSEAYSGDIAKLEDITGVSAENIIFLNNGDTISAASVKFHFSIAGFDEEKDIKPEIDSYRMSVTAFMKNKSLNLNDDFLREISEKCSDVDAADKILKENKFASFMIDLDNKPRIRSANGTDVFDCKKSL